jgi:hypothetical protein
VGGSATENTFTYDRKLVKGGGYQYNLDAAGLPAGTYTLAFRVSSDPPDVLESVSFTIR